VSATPLTLPLSNQAVENLRAGEQVMLSGVVLTGRDQACARLDQLAKAQRPLPVDLTGQLIYFVGPTPARSGHVIGSAGPTTTGRMNSFLPTLLDQGLRGFIGKGYIDDAVKEAVRKHHAVYFGAIGGSGALLSSTITAVQEIAFPELLTESIKRLTLNQFPAVVLYDAHGGDLYAQAKRREFP
jgi:fumarate hydratase subunit beta